MKRLLILLALLATTASGQGFNFPVGQETMANSMPVVVASDQSPILVTGSITATNPSVAPTGAAVPADATYIGINVSGNLQAPIGDGSDRLIVVGAGTAGTPAGGLVTVQGSASGTALPISAASLPLPTGAATSAKQPALGTAGSASTDVLTVQGIASMTPILVTPSGSGSTQPTNVAQFGGSNVVTGTGASGSGIPRVTVANDSTIGLVAGSAIVGKFGIDQTTPGTTNAVSATNFPTTVDTNTGVAGSSTPRVAAASHAVASNILANNPYASTNVTTSAYVQLIASTANAINLVCLSNSSGSIIKMATGAVSSEVDRIYIPGGGSGCWPVNIAASTRISLEALDATASTGYFLFTGML